MYVPENMQMGSVNEMQRFIDDYGFAVIVSATLEGNHLPLMLNKVDGEFGALYGHFSRANLQWRDLDGQSVMAIFSGPHSYISPGWYAARPAVPTWNYAAVHAFGVVTVVNAEQTLSVVEQTVRKYEPSLLFERNIVTEEYQRKLLRGIVGFKIAISDIEGKHKLGQHRSLDDQRGVMHGLQQSGNADAVALLHYMRSRNIAVAK